MRWGSNAASGRPPHRTSARAQVARKVPAVSELPCWFRLLVTHATQKGLAVMVLEGGQRAAHCVLGPTLGSVWKGSEKKRSTAASNSGINSAGPEFANQIRSRSDDVIVAMGKRFTQCRNRCLSRWSTELVQGGELLIKAALARHEWQFNAIRLVCGGKAGLTRSLPTCLWRPLLDDSPVSNLTMTWASILRSAFLARRCGQPLVEFWKYFQHHCLTPAEIAVGLTCARLGLRFGAQAG
jgi:hypothetical protein